MSRSAMPSALSAAMTLVIDWAAWARAALTVGLVTLTPRRRSAISGLTTTLPVPLTLMVCSGGVVGSAPAIGRGAKAGLAMVATRRPPASPIASHMAGRRGNGMVIDEGGI